MTRGGDAKGLQKFHVGGKKIQMQLLTLGSQFELEDLNIDGQVAIVNLEDHDRRIQLHRIEGVLGFNFDKPALLVDIPRIPSGLLSILPTLASAEQSVVQINQPELQRAINSGKLFRKTRIPYGINFADRLWSLRTAVRYQNVIGLEYCLGPGQSVSESWKALALKRRNIIPGNPGS